MASRDREQENRIEEIGSGLVNPPTDVHQLLLLLDRAESILARVGQRPRQLTLTALRPSMEALISRKLLKHPDLDVRVAVTSCLSELTRITAPNAPYDDELMKEIFELIVGSFKKLDEFSSRSFLKRVSILETVAKVRSCVLMLDLECDDLISDMFHHFLNTIRPQHSYTVTSSMETIMTLVIEESENVSARLLSGLLAHLKIDDRASMQNVTPAARKLAEKVIVKCTSKLKPYMINWFRDASMLREYSKMVATVYHGNLDTIGRKEEDSTNIPEMKVVNSGKFKEESNKENSYRKFMDQGDFFTPEMKGRQKHKDLEQTNTEPRLKECEISVTEEKGNLVIKEIHQLEDLAFQKLPIDTTQIYGEKGMKLITPLEAEHSQISNLEEQLTSGKHQSTDLNNSLEQQYTVIHELNVKATDISMMNEKVACPFHSPELVEAEISTDKCSLAQELKTRQEKLLEEEAHRKSLEVKNKWMAEDRVAYDPDLSKRRDNAIRPSSGLELITNLPKLHEVRETVLRLKAMIAKILALQKSEELNVQTHAIETVADLALKDYNHLRFVEEGGLDTLLLFLGASKGETFQRLTAAVVANLAISGLHQALIADKGGTRLSTSRAIQPEDPQTLWVVAWAIADVCGKERVRKGVKESGFVKGVDVGCAYGILFGAWALLLWDTIVLVLHQRTNGGKAFTTILNVIFSGCTLGQAAPTLSSIAKGQVAPTNSIKTIAKVPKALEGFEGAVLPDVLGQMEFCQVCFSYPSRKSIICEGLSFTITAGSTTAIVGKDGSGKGTVIYLIERFYEPTSGKILLDHHDTESIQWKWPRNQMGLVCQESAFFLTSITCHSLYGKEDADIKDIMNAAIIASAQSFIEHLPNGYLIEVEAREFQLCGGQKQRIARARDILRNPKILLLVEAPSALDLVSEFPLGDKLGFKGGGNVMSRTKQAGPGSGPAYPPNRS